MSHDEEIAGFGLEKFRRMEAQKATPSTTSQTLPEHDDRQGGSKSPPANVESGRGQDGPVSSRTLSRGGEESGLISTIERTLQGYVEVYVGGEANFARTIRSGGFFIGGQDQVDEETKDRLITDFNLQLEKSSRRQDELRVEEGGEDGGNGKRKRKEISHVEGGEVPGVVEWSEVAEPLPNPPTLPSSHPSTITINSHPELFKVVTPLDVDLFKFYLISHPNDAFADSVCEGFERGFWPWAQAEMDGYPSVNDQAQGPADNPAKAQFLREQRDHELEMGRYSVGFEGNLEPGMYSMPVFAVPKDEDYFRLVIHQSFGPYSLNSMTPPHKRAFPLDNMIRLGDILLRAHRERKPGEELVLWKCDVAEAYRLLPIHNLWQIKQVVTIEGVRYIDRCVAFGGRRSGDLFIAFMSLILWIAENASGVVKPCAYSDDCFGVDIVGELEWYEPYGVDMPPSQSRMLHLWDELRIPHKRKKQISGKQLTIIGFEVDAEKLMITLPPDKKQALLRELDRFIFPVGKRGQRLRLKEYAALAGWVSWSLNVFPMLRPGLATIYAKIGNLSRLEDKVKMTRAISNDLEWLKGHIENSSGIRIITARDWPTGEANFVAYVDASLTGLGYWIPSDKEGYYATIPYELPSSWIYIREMLATLSAMYHAMEYQERRDQKILIYTDNMNTVEAFNSLKADPTHNGILKQAVDLALKSNCQFRVLHIEGTLNSIADALSRRQLDRARQLCSDISLIPFLPPRDSLGEFQQ